MSSSADVKALVALSQSADFREKVLKLMQYSAKLATLTGSRSPTLQRLAKSIGAARRLICLLRWVRYYEDYVSARDEPMPALRAIVRTEAALNFVVDGLQDLVTLQQLGLLGPLGKRLPPRLAQVADTIDSANLSLGMLGAALRLQRTLAAAPASAEHPHGNGGGVTLSNGAGAGSRSASERQKVVRSQLALLKYGCDLLKAVDASGVGGSHLPGAQLGALGGLVSSVLSSHKLAEKLATRPKAA